MTILTRWGYVAPSPMHVQFEFTKEDLVDACERFLRRRAAIASLKSSGIVGSLVGLFLFLLLRSLSSFAWVLAVLAAATVIFLYPLWQRYRLHNSLRKMADETMTGPGPYICEVEAGDGGLWIRQMDEQTIYDWKSLQALEETADSVDIFGHDGGGVIVRNRAFVSEADRATFIELVRSRLANNRRDAE